MMKRRCLLNNLSMDVCRKDKVYAAVIIDLALAGAINKAVAENLLGYAIPDSVKSPFWYKEEKVPELENAYESGDE